MKIKVNKYLKLFFKIALSLGALYFVFTKIPIKQVLELYKKAHLGYIIVAIVLFALSKTIAAYRLNRLFHCISIPLSNKANLKLYFLGMFYNLFLPGGIGGDGYKIFLLKNKFDVKGGRVFWAILIDRLNGLLALFCLSILLLSIIPVAFFSFDHRYYVWLAIPVGVGIFYILLKRYHTVFLPVFWKINLQSLFVQLTQTICAFFILRAFGPEHDYFSYILLFLISSIVATLPITIGGVGSREIVFLFGAPLLGLDPETSIALSIMFYLITLFVSFFGIFYSIGTSGLKLDSNNKET